jgi:hypothetical protein
VLPKGMVMRATIAVSLTSVFLLGRPDAGFADRPSTYIPVDASRIRITEDCPVDNSVNPGTGQQGFTVDFWVDDHAGGDFAQPSYPQLPQ